MIFTLEPELLQQLSHRGGARDTAVADELDGDLAAAVRRTALIRRLFYLAVLAVALYGTATGLVARSGLPRPVAVAGVVALELGGVVFLSNAEVRRRLGEPARLPQLIGVTIAAAAATFNLLTHDTPLLGGFFALMSALGFTAWWLDAENKRRDRLRARGQMPAPTPSYPLWSHWLRHPAVTCRARTLARAYPQLGLYGSVEAALITMRRERRNAALAAALRTRIRRAVGKDLAGIAVLTFDMDQVAHRLTDSADYDGMTALLAGELNAKRILNRQTDPVAADAGPSGSTTGTKLDTGTSQPPHQGATTTPEPQTAAATSRRPAIAQAHLDEATARTHDHPPPTHNASTSTNTPAVRATSHSPASDPPPTISTPQRRVQIRVMGTPAILDSSGNPVGGVRAKSTELLVYLAIHQNGATTSDILEAIWPNVPPERATQRLSTCLANLRGIIRQETQSAGMTAVDSRIDPVEYTGSGYRLARDVIEVDWWRTQDALRQTIIGGNDPPAHEERLRQAKAGVDDLIRNHNYPWIDAHRNAACQHLAALDQGPD